MVFKSTELQNEQHEKIRTAIKGLNLRIRHLIPRPAEAIDLERVGISEVKEGYLDGQAIKRVIFILRGSGCKWALENHGGCSMCGHLAGTTLGKGISADIFIRQFEEELGRYDFAEYPMLCVYNSGSFLNDEEIPGPARRYMLERINDVSGVRRLIIESRPEYVTDEVLDEMEEILTDVEVEIGVGLESSSDIVRDLCLNKGFTAEEFEGLAARLKSRNVLLLAYVLLKPPFLTETEGIADASETIRFAFSVGADIVSLEPVSVQDYTLTGFLYEASYFRPPWIWSVIEVLKRTWQLGFVRIGGFEFFPIPKVFTHNCPKCNERMVEAIKDFNKRYKIESLRGITCECQREWREDLMVELPPLPGRIGAILSRIEEKEVLMRMRMASEVRGVVPEDIRLSFFRSCSTPNL